MHIYIFYIYWQDLRAYQAVTKLISKLLSDFYLHSDRKLTPPMDKFISDDTVPPLCLPATAQVVRLVPGSTVPNIDDQIRKEESDDEDPGHVRSQSPLGYLEVADVGRR